MSIFPSSYPPEPQSTPPAPPAPPPSAPPPQASSSAVSASTAIRASAILSAASASARRRKLEGSGSVYRGHCVARGQRLSLQPVGSRPEGSYGKRGRHYPAPRQIRGAFLAHNAHKPEKGGRTSRPVGAGTASSQSCCRPSQGRSAQEGRRDQGSTRGRAARSPETA